MKFVELKEFAVSGGGAVDPSKYPQEIFDLYSIQAYDSYMPEILLGAEIGSTKKVVQPNDVLLSRIVPHIRRAWVVGPNTGRRQIASGEWIIFRGDSFAPDYLRHFLMSDPFHQQLMQTVSGVGGSLLRARPSEVEKIKVSLPPLTEQERISAILNKADAIRRKRQQAIKLADDFLRATFLDMFGNPITNPKGWEVKRLDEIAFIQSGITKGRRLNGHKVINIPYMRVANVQDGHINLMEIKEIEATSAEIERYSLLRGDILLTEGGDPDKLGRGAVWLGEISPCIHQNHIFRVRPNPDYSLSDYLSALIGSARGKQYFLTAAKQTTGIASINMTQLKSFPVLLPPLYLQQEFAEIVQNQIALRKKLDLANNQQDNCFHSLTQRAFRGEL